MIRPRHASHISVGALALAAVLLPAFAAAQPSLAYDPPAGWTRGPYSSPVVYTAPGGEAELHVYDFQRYAGDAKRRFHETRLFELIGIEHRETGPLDPAKYAEIQVQGAGAVPLAIFLEQRGGVNRLHVRVAIPQPGAVALVDYHARGQDAWNRYLPEVDRVFASMRVGEAPAAPAGAPRPAQGASGLYLATVRRLVFRATGGSEWTLNIAYYLLDPDGKCTKAGCRRRRAAAFSASTTTRRGAPATAPSAATRSAATACRSMSGTRERRGRCSGPTSWRSAGRSTSARLSSSQQPAAFRDRLLA